jgi:hypothetical protein
MSSPEGGYRHLAWKAARWKVLTEATPEFGFWDSGLWTSGSCRLLLRTAGHQKISEASKTHTRRLIKARPPSRPPALNEERVRTLDSVILNGTPETPGRISGHWNRSVWTPDRPPPPPVKSAQCPDSGLRTLASAMAALNALVCEQLLAEALQHLPTSARAAFATPHVAEAAAVRELQAAHSALGTVREEAATVGQQLLPLRSPAELATLLQAELLYPPGTPKRSYEVLVELRTRGVTVPSEFELDLLLVVRPGQPRLPRVRRGRWGRLFVLNASRWLSACSSCALAGQ